MASRSGTAALAANSFPLPSRKLSALVWNANFFAPGFEGAELARWCEWTADIAPERNHVHVQRISNVLGDLTLKSIHVGLSAELAFACLTHPTQPSRNSPAV